MTGLISDDILDEWGATLEGWGQLGNVASTQLLSAYAELKSHAAELERQLRGAHAELIAAQRKPVGDPDGWAVAYRSAADPDLLMIRNNGVAPTRAEAERQLATARGQLPRYAWRLLKVWEEVPADAE